MSISAITTAPAEILQQVFWFVAFGTSEERDSLLPLRLSSVNEQWRHIVLNCPLLWAALPPIKLGDTGVKAIHRTRKTTSLYLTRSGGLPITFELNVQDELWDKRKNLVLEVIRLLASECQRWEGVTIRFSKFWYEHLFPPIQGRLPLLSNLNISSSSCYWEDIAASSFDAFAIAPRLRRLCYNVRWVDNIGHATPGPEVAFPWTQLESIQYTTLREDVYTVIMDANPTALRSLVYAEAHFRALPRLSPFTLPQITTMRLRALIFSCDIITHLGELILPALTHFELWGRMMWAGPSNDQYPSMSALVRRSGCSLKQLALASSNKPVEYGDFCELLSLCPELESLDIPLPDKGSTIFNSLIVEPSQTALTPIAPKLRTLGLHYHSRALLQPDFGMPDCVNALVDAIQSRSPPRGGRLEEVNFFWASTPALHNMLFVGNSAFDSLDGGVDTKSDKMFNDTGRLTMHKHLQGGSSEYSWQAAYYSPTFAVKMDLFMRTLEGRQVNKANTLPLLRYGYLGALYNLSQEEPGVIVGDRVFRFRSRARKLLSKWKPFIIRDTLRFGYRWCQYNEGDLSLKWNKAGENDEDVWCDILTTRGPPGLDPKVWSGCFEQRPKVPMNL